MSLVNFKSLFNNTGIEESNGNTTLPSYTGFIFLALSSLFYGSNYLPVKQYETGILDL